MIIRIASAYSLLAKTSRSTNLSTTCRQSRNSGLLLRRFSASEMAYLDELCSKGCYVYIPYLVIAEFVEKRIAFKAVFYKRTVICANT